MTRRRVASVLSAVIAAAALVVVGAPAQAAAGDIITVNGTVLDGSGLPVAGVYLSVSSGASSQVVQTDASGTYAVDIVASQDTEFVQVGGVFGPAGLVCDPTAFTSAPATVTINCEIHNLITVELSGVAHTDDGSSPEGRPVYVSDQNHFAVGGGQLASDGSFSFTIRALDTVTELYVSGLGTGTPAGPLSPVFDGASFSGIEFTYHPLEAPVERDMTVQGRVVDKKGKPVAGATVDVAGGYNGVHTTTDAGGYYVATGQWLWLDSSPFTEPVVVYVNGTLVEYVDTLNPYTPTVVDYRIGKTPVYELVIDDAVLGEYPVNTDVYKKTPKSGPAEWYVESDISRYHFVFGSKKTEILGPLPVNTYAGTQELLLRDVHGGQVDWFRFDADGGMSEQATFGYTKLDGLEYFDFVGLGGSADVVAWADKGGRTTVWTWGIADAVDGVQSTVIDGKLDSFTHRELDLDAGEEVVVVTHSGKNYRVTLLGSSSEAPVTVSAGRGEPTVTYTDSDGDHVFDIVVTYPDRTTHKHRCAH